MPNNNSQLNQDIWAMIAQAVAGPDYGDIEDVCMLISVAQLSQNWRNAVEPVLHCKLRLSIKWLPDPNEQSINWLGYKGGHTSHWDIYAKA